MIPCLAIRYWLYPCLPFSPGFWILETCSKYHTNIFDTFALSGFLELFYWACICSLVAWSVSILLANQFFVSYQLFFVVASCIRYYLNNLLLHIKNQRKQLSTPDLIRLYKKLQLMTCFFNRINQDMFTSVLLFINGLTYVICLFSFLTVKTSMSIPQLVILSSATCQVLITITFGYGIFGGIYNDSVRVLQAFRSKNTHLKARNETKVCVKLVHSLCPLKVMIGSVNYFDRLTPITLIDFFFGILVSLLLLK